MADTSRGDFADRYCVDCWQQGCSFSHCGPLIPEHSPQKWVSLCSECYSNRRWDNRQGRSPRPLGTLAMLSALERVEDDLPHLLAESGWKTLDVNYHPPRVKRLWGYYGELRISLHKIYPCRNGEALFHPHPWPSAMRILSGRYEMAVGYGGGDDPPPAAAKLILPAGTSYEMTDKHGWHYVRPLDEPSFSLLVTARPWQRSSPKGENLQPLTNADKWEILDFFRTRYPKG